MQQYWLAFSQVRGIGPIRLRQLRTQFTTLEEAWYASAHTLQALGWPATLVEEILKARARLNPDVLMEQVQRLNAWVLTLDDPDYPALLRELDDAPAVLYGRGRLIPSDDRALAVVGTRRASGYGREMTRRLVGELVAHDFTIVSGLAYGIDAIAHQAALDVGGRTLAVLGSGIDLIYPGEHRGIVQHLIERGAGAILSEFPPGTKPERGNFPIRNRIISGLSLGTLVIEAPEHSGSLHTAELAAEQGREVFAVPGPATSANSRGTHRLIQDGAKLVMEIDDILRELNLAHQTAAVRHIVTHIAPDNPQEALILQTLRPEPLHVDELSRVCGMSVHELNAVLVLMELKGKVYQIAPMTYHTAD